MDDNEPLGPGTELYIASCVADGTATPKEATRLLVEFVRQADAGKVSAVLIEHFAACIRAFLAGKKNLLPAPEAGRPECVGVPIPTLEKAFGLSRIAPGKPRVDDDTLSIVASEVLALLLEGKSVQDAAALVAEDRNRRGEQVSSDSQVRAAWASHKAQGWLFMRIGRSIHDELWSPEELARLNNIFDGVPGIVPPGMSVTDYWRKILPGEPLPQTITPNYPENNSA